MYFLGMDIGSTTGKGLLLDGDEKILGTHIVEATTSPEKTARRCLQVVLKKCGIKEDDITFVMGTGYGRVNFSFANANVSEISCHAKGAKWLDPTIRTVLDIGGQDVKAISVRDDGGIAEFVMNDKCAAGTGRFLQNQARALGLDVGDFSELSGQAEKPTTISSQCSVFAESEVITQVNEGFPVPDIVAGIHESIAVRLIGLLKRVGIKESLVVTGGCAKNQGLIGLLEKRAGMKVVQLKEDPQIVGALGAALLARNRHLIEVEKKRETTVLN
ncbi:MAG: CoA activase [Desulfatitalea sp.]|nr:hypothetical protein [Desulfatitalea sp.]NNK00199.1 CoA activase [Desulfatitalea sp.]